MIRGLRAVADFECIWSPWPELEVCVEVVFFVVEASGDVTHFAGDVHQALMAGCVAFMPVCHRLASITSGTLSNKTLPAA